MEEIIENAVNRGKLPLTFEIKEPFKIDNKVDTKLFRTIPDINIIGLYITVSKLLSIKSYEIKVFEGQGSLMYEVKYRKKTKDERKAMKEKYLPLLQEKFKENIYDFSTDLIKSQIEKARIRPNAKLVLREIADNVIVLAYKDGDIVYNELLDWILNNDLSLNLKLESIALYNAKKNYFDYRFTTILAKNGRMLVDLVQEDSPPFNRMIETKFSTQKERDDIKSFKRKYPPSSLIPMETHIPGVFVYYTEEALQYHEQDINEKED